MQKFDTWFAIVNPKAGGGRGLNDWPKIQKHLADEGVKYDFCITKHKYHAVELTVKAIREGHRKIISVGGDGTLNEIVNGVFIQKEVPTIDILIGVIGVGTGNDWQRTYSIPNNYFEGIRAICEGRTFLQDVGVVNFFESKVFHTRYFANVGGVGFDAEVAQATNSLKESGRKGRLLYIISLLKVLLNYSSSIVSISIDGKPIGGRFFSISLGICKYSGSGMIQVPNALLDDGLFEITVIEKLTRLDVIRTIPRLYNGSILKHPKIKGYQGKNIVISSRPPVMLEVDGESLGTSPFTFGILPRAIRVVVGADFKTVTHQPSACG